MTTRYQPRLGDTVRIGRGKKLWIVDRIWEKDPQMVSLLPVEGYSGTSCSVARLLLVDEAPAARQEPRGDMPSALW